jgi:hypothetical protein
MFQVFFENYLKSSIVFCAVLRCTDFYDAQHLWTAATLRRFGLRLKQGKE